MGAVLAMTSAAWRGRAAGLLGALALAGCEVTPEGAAPAAGAAREARLLGAVAQVQRVLGGVGVGGGVGAPRAVPGGFAPEAIAADPSAYRFVQINALGLAEPARVIQENGPEATLAFRSGPIAAFDGGILASTRGLGEDLWTLSAPGLPAMLRAGAGRLTRVMETLDDQDQVVSTTFECTVAAKGTETIDLSTRQATARRVEESCEGEAVIFNNVYWLDAAGDVLASQQFVSPTVAYLRSNRL